MSHQYQPTSYYDWPNRTHGLFLQDGVYKYVHYDYYGGDELHTQNVVFRNSQYVTYDNTHVRFLNKSDLHLYDTTDIKIHDSGTFTMYTSASPSARKFVVDEIGRVGIGLDHDNEHKNRGEQPSFDLDVRGQVGVEDYIYHNDDVDTYMLFGSDLTGHYVNTTGDIHDLYPDDQDEINFRVGGIDILQMQTRDVAHLESGTQPTGVQDHMTINKYQSDVDVVIRTVDEPNMVFVDGLNNRVSIGDSEDAPQATLEVKNHPDAGAFDVPLVQLNNKDTDKQLLDINADNIDADVISVSADMLVSADVITLTADSLTTGDVLNATADSLTTGSLIHMTHTGSDKSEVSLVHFESTGDRGDDTNQTVLLDLNFDTTTGTGARALRIDSEQTTGTVIEVDATEITSGRVLAIDADKLTTGKGIELLMDTRTTGTGLHIHDDAATDNAGALVKIEQAGDRSGEAASIGVDINFDTTANANARALRIDSEQTTGKVVQIDADEITSGEVIRVDADKITTGCILHLESDSNSTDTRSLFKLNNDNTAATKTTLAHVRNDAIADGIETVLIESTAKDPNPVLELRNSNAGVDDNTTHKGFPATLNFNRSNNTTADDMGLGLITFQGKNSTDEEITYADILVRATDQANTTEAGQITFRTQATDSPSQLRNVLTLGGQSEGAAAETVFNEDAFDINFRVESNASDPQENVTDTGTAGDPVEHLAHDSQYALFVDGENGRVGLGTGAPDTTLHVAGSAHIEGDLWVKGQVNRMDTYVYATSAVDITNIGTGPALTVTQTGSQPIVTFMDDELPALHIEDGGTNRAGFVGLGLSDPTQNLHVHRVGTTGTDHSYIQFTTGDTGATVSDGLHVGYDASNKAIISNKEATNLEIKTGNNVALAVDGSNQHVAVGPNSRTYTTLYVEATDGLRVPVGNIAQRPTKADYGITAASPTDAQFEPMHGTIRYNKEISTFEGFGAGNTWGSLGGVIDPDRDTYWTAVNDLDDLHDPGQTDDIAGQYGTDEFADTDYPGDVDYLRAFTRGVKRFAIASNGDSRWYHKSSGAGTKSDPYVYSNMLQIQPKAAGVNINSQTTGKSIEISTKDTPSTLATNAGDITIVGGSALDRTTTGSGGAGADIVLTAGSGANRKTSGNGGKGGDITLTSGSQGTGGTAGARGKIILDSKGAIDVDAVDSFTVDATGISLDSDAASNFTTSVGALTFSGGAGVNIDGTGQEVDITTSGGAIDMNAGSLDVDTTGGVTIDATGISLDSDAASNFSTSAGALTFSGGQGVNINGTGQEIDITTTNAKIDMNAGSLDVDLDQPVAKTTNSNGTNAGAITLTGARGGKGHTAGKKGGTGTSITIASGLGGQANSGAAVGDSGVVQINVGTTNKLEVSNVGTDIQDHNGSSNGLHLNGTLVTANAGELNLVDGSSAGTVVNGKAVIYSDAGAVNATTAAIGNPTAPAGTFAFGVGGNGYVTGDWYVQTGSDERLKKNIKPIENPIDKLNQIGGYSFDWNPETSTSYQGRDYGVIAQEVEQVMPEIVKERDTGYKALSYDRLIPLLIECVKDQQKQIDELKQLLSVK